MTVLRQHDEAFVLETRAIGEADLIVTLLAQEHGKVRTVARSARSSRRRFGGLLEPLTWVRAAWTERDGRQLHRLDELEAVRSFAEMQSEPVRQATCAVLADVASSFAHEGQSDPQTFRLLGAVLDALERGAVPWILLRYFEYWMLRIHGLLPDLAHCVVCAKPLPGRRAVRIARNRGALCSDCPRVDGEPEARLSGADHEFLESAAGLPPLEMPRNAARFRGSGAIELLLRGMVEAFAERRFRTYRHFRAAEPLSARGSEA